MLCHIKPCQTLIWASPLLKQWDTNWESSDSSCLLLTQIVGGKGQGVLGRVTPLLLTEVLNNKGTFKRYFQIHLLERCLQSTVWKWNNQNVLGITVVKQMFCDFRQNVRVRKEEAWNTYSYLLHYFFLVLIHHCRKQSFKRFATDVS